MPRQAAHDRLGGKKSSASLRTTHAGATDVGGSVKKGRLGTQKSRASSSSPGDRYTSDRGIFTSPVQSEVTALPSVASASTVVSGVGGFGINAEDILSLAAQEQEQEQEKRDGETGLRPAEAERENDGVYQTSDEGSVCSVIASPVTRSPSKRDVTQEDLTSCTGKATEVEEADCHDHSAITGLSEPAKTASHENVKDTAQEDANDGDNSDLNLAMFVPILAVDTATNEIIDYRTSGVPPPSPPFFSAAGGGTGAPSSSATSSAIGVGGGHLAQPHITAAVMPSTGFPSYATRPVSSAFNVLPTPMLSDLVGGGGLTNTSFARRGVPNNSFSRRSANITSAAARYADPGAAAVARCSQLPAPLITPRTPPDLPMGGGGGVGVLDERPLAIMQPVASPRLSGNPSTGLAGSEAGTRTSDSAGLGGGGTSVLESMAAQIGNVTDVNTATLPGCANGEGNPRLPLTKGTAGSVTTLSVAPSPLSAEMKRESARRLGKLLDQLPASKYAAAIVFLEGLMSSSGGDSDVSGTPETAAISMITTISDASNCSRGLFRMAKGATDAALEARGLSGEGQSPLVGPHTSGRLWLGTFGRETSPTALAPNLAHLGNRGSGPGSAVATSGSNESGVAPLGGVSRAPEDGGSDPVSRADSASVEALVRDALSHSVLQSLSPHKETPRIVTSLSACVDASARGSSDSTSGGVSGVSPPSALEGPDEERLVRTVAATACAEPLPAGSSAPVAPGNRCDGLTSNASPCNLSQNILPLPGKSADAAPSHARRQASSPSPPSGDVSTPAAASQAEHQVQEHSALRKATEEPRDSETTTIRLPPLSVLAPSSSADNSGLALREIPLQRQHGTVVAPPIQLEANSKADPDNSTTPGSSPAGTAAAANVREAYGSNKDKDKAAFGEGRSCNVATHLSQQSQNRALRHGLLLDPSPAPLAKTHVTSLYQSPTADAGDQNTIYQVPTPAAAASKTPALNMTAPLGAIKDTQRSPSNGDRDALTPLELCGTSGDAGKSLDVDANVTMCTPQGSSDRPGGLVDETANPMMAHKRPAESAALLSTTESIADSSTDSHSRERQEGWRPHSRSTCEASATNVLGHSLETFEDAHLPRSAAVTATRERPWRSPGLCSGAAKFSSATPRGSSGVVGWGDIASDSPSPPLPRQHPHSAGDEVTLEDVDLGATLRRAVALAAAAGTHSERAAFHSHSKDNCDMGERVSSSGIVATEPLPSADAIEGQSYPVPVNNRVTASTKTPTTAPVAALHPPKTTSTTHSALDTSRPLESPLVTSSVVVAMNSFFSREDQIVPGELDVVREVVAHYDAFAALDETQLETLVRTMTRVELQRGATAVCEGDQTLLQLLFIVSGKLAVSRKGLVTRTLTRGQFYGEVEMSYHVKRSRVTLTAAAPTVVFYTLKKEDYQKLVIHEKDARRYMFLQYVNECVLFKGMPPHVKMRLADSLRVCRLRKGTKLTEQGAPVQWMYLLMSGTVRMTHRPPSSFGGETSDALESKYYAGCEDDAHHMTAMSHNFSNCVGSTVISEALTSSFASALPVATIAGSPIPPSGIAASLAPSFPPSIDASQELTPTVLAQVTAASVSTGAQHPQHFKDRPVFSVECRKRCPLSTVTTSSHGVVVPTQHLPPLLNTKRTYENTRSESGGDHLEAKDPDDGSRPSHSSCSRNRRFPNQPHNSASDWQVSPQPPSPAILPLDIGGHQLPSSLSVPAPLRQSMSTLLDPSIHSNASNIPGASPTSPLATPTGTFSSNGVAVVVDRSKGQLVGETEFVFKCQGLFTAVATTPVQAARISRLHFEAIMACPVMEEMKRSMLLNPDYYFFESTVPEKLKEEMRRMLFRLNVGPAGRRHRRLAQQQHFLRSARGVDGTMSCSHNGDGTSRERGCSKGGRSHGGRNLGSLRCTQREQNCTPFTSSIVGGTIGPSSGVTGTTASSGPHHPSTAHLEQTPMLASLTTGGVNAIGPDATGMESSGMCCPAAPGVNESPVASSALTKTFSVSAAGAGEALVPKIPSLTVTKGNTDTVNRGKGSSSDGGHLRYLRATEPLSTAYRGTSFTKHSTTTTGSRRRRISTRGEIVFSGSRNLYRFSAEAMSMNESILIAVVVDGTIIRWNSVAQRVTGYAPFDVIGKNIFDFIVSDDGRQHMRDTLAFAARFAGKWEHYCMHGLQEQRVFPFRQNTGLYQVGLALSVIPSNCSKTAEVLLLIGREGKYRAASTYAADVAKWLEGSLKPQLRMFQRRMGQIESRGWQVTTEDVLQVRGNLDACMSMVEQFTKFSMLNVEVVSQSWRPVRIPALLRRFAVEAMEFARQQRHEYYCNIDLVEPKREVFLDAPQVLAILRILLGDALRCPNVDDDGNPIVTHAELRVSVVVPQGTNPVPRNIKSPTGPLLPLSSPLITAPEDRSSGAAAEGLRNVVWSEAAVAKPSDLPTYMPDSAVEAYTDTTPLAHADVGIPPGTIATAHPPPDGPTVQAANAQKPNPPRGSEIARPYHSHDSPPVTLVSDGNLGNGGHTQGGPDGSTTPVAAAPPPGFTASTGTGMRGLTSAPTSSALTATLRRIRFELRDDGPTIPGLRDPKTVASERTTGEAVSEGAPVDAAGVATPHKEPSPISSSHTSEPAFGECVAGGGEHDNGLDANKKSFTFSSAASTHRGADLERVEKILTNLGGVVYGFTRPEAHGNVVRIELPLLAVPGSTDDGRDDENGGGCAGGGAAAPLSGATRTLTVIVADNNRLHQQQLCRVLWARQHAVVPVTNFRDLGRKLEMNTADILLIDPLHIDVVSEDYESLLGDDPFDDIRILSARLALVVMASDFSDWRVQKLLDRHAVVELPKVGSGALVHIAMQEAEQLVMEMRDEEERLELIRRTFTNSSTERHKVGKRIGKGAFGDVFEVEDTLTGGKMAMKRMRLHDGLLADEVAHEILAMSMLKHENIIQYFYCEKESDTMLRLYMELAPGGTLRDKIRELPGVPLPFAEIVHHLSCICHGLAYVHEQRYVHGDLKTANLLLGTRNRTKIGDFGTVKRLGPYESLYTMVGTPQYMAPEVLTADAEQRLGYDFKADIWSLGCIVLEMATGSPPFAHVESAQGMGIIKYLTELTDTPDLSPLFSGNPLVYEFVKSCLDVDPQNRPTAQELLHFDILEGAVASQRAERLVRRAETLYKLNKYAAVRADGGGGGSRGGAVRPRNPNGSEDSEEEVEGDDDGGDDDDHHSSVYGSGLLFSNSDSTAFEEDLDDDGDYVVNDDDDAVGERDGSELEKQDNYM
ncbi:hypothetical protein JKF63_05944 [Porcisia hertigi]|uniref:non-specific serine/threonine protein kinase n=1 Tax=Porcisia hertigi TaxID=2761500 RepID=A0A836IU41_9TRYP|nr:hypothetical protein JKF63_05944 [Porcisia hertigi]